MGHSTLLVGLGVTGRAVAQALAQRDEPMVLVDDHPDSLARRVAEDLGAELVEAPDRQTLARLVAGASAVVPAPGLPARHPAFEQAAAAGVPVLSEFDLAARWDDRPVLAVTGTDGKTTVTMMVTAMLEASGLAAGAVGNTDLPLVAAIDDPTLDTFVVEASSFRLAHSRWFSPAVGTWLNFAPDHLDNHRNLTEYEEAKARIWKDQEAGQVAVGNADDPVVARRLSEAAGQQVPFTLSGSSGFRVVDGCLVTDDDQELCRIEELARSFPHDLLNGLAAAATALYGGASLAGVREALVNFRGLPHRIELVGEAGGVRYYDDSKATTPHAAAAAVAGFESVVLICGGRNKGLDLTDLRAAAGPVRAVVAIGEATPEVVATFAGVRPVHPAGSMKAAVEQARDLARPGDAVLLSPGCASFDWYQSYRARGEDFAQAVHALAGEGRG